MFPKGLKNLEKMIEEKLCRNLDFVSNYIDLLSSERIISHTMWMSWKDIRSPYLFASCGGISNRNKVYLIIILMLQILADPEASINVATQNSIQPPCI